MTLVSFTDPGEVILFKGHPTLKRQAGIRAASELHHPVDHFRRFGFFFFKLHFL